NREFSYINFLFFFSSRRRQTRSKRDWSSDVCSSDLCIDRNVVAPGQLHCPLHQRRRAPLRGRWPQCPRHQPPRRALQARGLEMRSEERRVGKECRGGVWPDEEKEKKNI